MKSKQKHLFQLVVNDIIAKQYNMTGQSEIIISSSTFQLIQQNCARNTLSFTSTSRPSYP